MTINWQHCLGGQQEHMSAGKPTPSVIRSDPQGLTLRDRPTLDLSGPKLRLALEQVIRASEAIGGVERFVAALKLKSDVLKERFGDGRAATLERGDFEEACLLMPTVRRRVGKLLDAQGWSHVRGAIVALLHDAIVPGSADARMAVFERHLSTPRPYGEKVAPLARSAKELGPDEGQPNRPKIGQAAAPHLPFGHPLPAEGRGEGKTPPRFLRDLAAEILHNVYPEHYPLMTRWVWDAKANSGALREIWHDPVAGDDVDSILISADDTHETFLVLREELSQFLSDQGIFRDMLWYVDLLLGHVYGGYINAQGGAWLKTEFGSEADPLEHTRRILGVDARIAREKHVGWVGAATIVEGVRDD